ncbi:MAG: aldo/keto reductase [Candidatus Heimdallarchaeota archaeon]|nr:aldo/keto reductase [Candidatus Heimdallarchaeota archaeon]MCK4769967.1 aldo/keto reductase [Candidatus Heimdallarchaeota archaeon]
MEYTRLGSTGIKISKIVLGTMQMGWRIEEEESFKVMDKAVELGINCFDTADVYTYWADNSYPGKTEEIIGRWLKDRETRDDLILATKLRGAMSEDINNRGLSRRHVHQAIQNSLKRLQTSWIDLYQIHSFDNDTPIEETLHALNLLVERGVVNYIGASNIHPWMLVESFWVSKMKGYARFETVQPPYSIVRRMLVEHQMEHIIKNYGLGIIPYSPLAGGFLTDRYSSEGPLPDTPRSEGAQKRYFTEKRWKIHDTVKEIAQSKDVKMTQIAIAWILSKEFITAPIIGANSVEQLEENFASIDIKLDEDEIKRLNEVSNWVDDYEAIR